MKRLNQCLIFSTFSILRVFTTFCEARHLHQSQDAQSFYQSFSQKAQETGPLQLMPLPDALQNLQTAVSEGKVTSFLQTNSPNQASQDDDGVPTLQSANTKVGLTASKTVEMPKVQPDEILKVADEATERLIDGPLENMDFNPQGTLAVNPDEAPRPVATNSNLKDIIKQGLPLPKQVPPEMLLGEGKTPLQDLAEPLLEMKSQTLELPSAVKNLVNNTHSKFQSFAARARSTKDSGPFGLVPIRPDRLEAAFEEGSKELMLPTQDSAGMSLPLSGRLPGGGHSFAEVSNQRSASTGSALAPAPSLLRAPTGSMGKTLHWTSRDRLELPPFPKNPPIKGFADNAQRFFNPVTSLLPGSNAAAQRSAVAVAATQANPLTNAFVVNHAVTQTGQLLRDYAEHLPDLMPLPFQEPLSP